jgi:threonine dehydrogenase-like Zn-dependent dehydrogenase
MCQFISAIGADDLVAIGDLSDGTPVYENSHIGGLAELMVAPEEWIVPLFTRANTVELGMVCSCVTVAGLGAATSPNLAPVEPASGVAVVGCGPLGLSAIQGARIAGASTIIAIDPIRVRRELALRVGATHALDPNVERDALIQKVRELTVWPTDRLWAGGRNPAGRRPGAGADFVIEAAGADQFPPGLEAGPDPTGILPIPAWSAATSRFPERCFRSAASRTMAARPAAPVRCATFRASSATWRAVSSIPEPLQPLSSLFETCWTHTRRWPIEPR